MFIMFLLARTHKYPHGHGLNYVIVRMWTERANHRICLLLPSSAIISFVNEKCLIQKVEKLTVTYFSMVGKW